MNLDVMGFGADPGATVTLIDGTTADIGQIRFDSAVHHFYVGNNDITDLLYRRDKATYWPNFDETRDNERLYVEDYFRRTGQLPPTVGSTSVWANFLKQVTTDPLSAPLAAANKAVSQIGGSFAFKAVAIGGGLLLLGIILARR